MKYYLRPDSIPHKNNMKNNPKKTTNKNYLTVNLTKMRRRKTRIMMTAILKMSNLRSMMKLIGELRTTTIIA